MYFELNLHVKDQQIQEHHRKMGPVRQPLLDDLQAMRGEVLSSPNKLAVYLVTLVVFLKVGTG